MHGRFWLPASARPSAPARDRFCRICKTDVAEHEYASHVGLCYSRNEADVRMLSLRERAPGIVGDHGVDLEHEAWWRKRGGLDAA
jgi:hypothetical protein